MFLTLLLAHFLEEHDSLDIDTHANTGQGGFSEDPVDELGLIRNYLHEQETRNLALAPVSVHAGARLYRTWLENADKSDLVALCGVLINRWVKPGYRGMVAQ